MYSCPIQILDVSVDKNELGQQLKKVIKIHFKKVKVTWVVSKLCPNCVQISFSIEIIFSYIEKELKVVCDFAEARWYPPQNHDALHSSL